VYIWQNCILHDKTRNIFFALKQGFCAFEIFSILSNGGHPGWKADLSDIILKGDHPSTIPAKFGLICHSGFTFKEDFLCFKYECSCMISCLTYIPGFFRKYTALPIFDEYAN
jgi:hypothetical protein